MTVAMGKCACIGNTFKYITYLLSFFIRAEAFVKPLAYPDGIFFCILQIRTRTINLMKCFYRSGKQVDQ